MPPVANQQTDQVFLTTAQLVQRLLQLLAEGRVDQAADIYSRCQEDVGYVLVNKAKTQEKLQKLLANMFFRARDFEKAALCCENLGEFAKAASLYEQADDYQSAAEMYAKVENFEKAAEMFERNQNFRQAAELFLKVKNFARAAANFEKAVDYFLSGKLYHELGKFRKSIELLQKVQAEDERFVPATILIGDILARHGYVDLAIKKLLGVIKDRPVGAQTAELYYHLADLQKRRGNLNVAAEIYQRLLDYDINYKDAADRLAELKGASAAPPPLVGAAAAEEAAEGEGQNQIVGVLEGFDFLRRVPLFEDMPLSEMRAFYNVCEERVFEPGELLIEQDRPGLALFVIREGQVSVVRREGDKEREVAQLGPGEYVGEMSLVDDGPTSARVLAKTRTVTFEISRDNFLRFMRSNDRFAVRVMRVFVRTLCQRLRKTTAELAGREGI